MATAAELAIVLKAKDEASAVLKKVSGEIGGLDKAGASAGKGLSAVSGGFKVVGAAAAGITVAVAGVAALGAALAPVIGAAAGFEQRMSAIKAVSGATGPEIQQLSKLALDLGKATSFSAGEAAQGIEELVKGGVSIGDIFGGAAAAALDLAAAGGVSVGEAATIASNAMNQFNLQGSDMAHVADLVAGAANASSISVSDFNQSLASGGAVAAAAGQSIDSYTTAVALMGAAGIKGSDAGTSLKAMFNTLIPTTDAAKTAMRDLGIITADGTNQFIDATGRIKDYGQIAEIIQTQTEGLTEAQKLLALETIFGADGMRAALVAAKAGGEGYDEMGKKILATGGAAAVARERLNNLSGDVEQLKGSAETAAIIVGSVFIPALRSVAQGATAMVNAFAQEAATLIETAQNISGAHGIGMIPAALTAVELRIGEAFGSRAQAAFHDTRRAVEDAARAFETVRDRLLEMAQAARDEATPGLQGLGRAAAGAAPAVDALGDALERTGSIVEPLTAQYADFLIQQGLVTQETAAATGAAQRQGAVLDALWSVLRNNPMSAAIDAFLQLGEQIESAQTAAADAATGMDQAWQRFIAGAGEVRDQVVARLEEVSAFISALPARFAADGAATGLALVTAIVSALNPITLVTAVVNMVQQAIAAGGAAGQGASAIGSAIAQGMANGLAGGVGLVIGAAVNVAQRAIAAAKAALGVASPSKVFEEIGEDVDQGFIDGVAGMAPEVEAAVAGVMEGAGEAAVLSAEDAFAALGEVLGAQYEKQYSIVEEAENKLGQLRNESAKKYQRDRELEETKHQRRLADLQESLAGQTVKQRQATNEKIQQLQENHQRKLEDLAEAHADRLIELEYDNSDLLAAAAEKQALLAGEALRDFQRGVEDVQRDTARAAEAIARKAGEAVSDAMRDAADSIMEAKDRAAEAIAELEASQALSRDVRGQRDAFSAGQDEESRLFAEKREDADLEYRLQKDLEKAKLKLGRDRAKAETEEERRQLDVRYAEEVEDLRRGFQDAKVDLARRRQLDEDERAFRKQQNAALQAFNDALEDAALQRQITRIQEERDSRIAEIQTALDEKIARVRQNEKDENQALRESAAEKLEDLRTRFYDKVGRLNEESKNAFESLFGAIKDGVDAAAKAVLDLSEAINRAAGGSGRAPGGSGGSGGGDGSTWANQPQSVRDMFTAAHGGNAQARWEAEHNRELAARMGIDLPEPTGYDPTSGLPTGPGYFEPVPTDPYWQENWDRFNPLPYGTEYPPQAFYSSDSTSRDVFGGNNTSASDYYATGGIVPGPPGVARRAVVHGGEGVFTPDQMAALAQYGVGGGGYAPHGHDIVLDGRVVGRAVEPYVSGAQDSAVRLGLG